MANWRKCPECEFVRISPWKALCVDCAKREADRNNVVKRLAPEAVNLFDVYCVESGLTSPVKFGISRFFPNRLDTLQAHSPLRLTTVGIFKDRRSLETRIFRLLDEYRCWGEWFERRGKVLDVVECFRVGARERLEQMLRDAGHFLRVPPTSPQPIDVLVTTKEIKYASGI